MGGALRSFVLPRLSRGVPILSRQVSGETEPVFTIDPLADDRWDALVHRNPRASVFHSRAWLRALNLTYGYEPVAYTLCAPSEPLTNAAVFCRIRSWLTGTRLVSLPFSDHCEPLVREARELDILLRHLDEERRVNGWNYVEIRPIEPPPASLYTVQRFALHRLNLRPPLAELLKHLHKDCIQRKIRRAQRERLIYEEGRSPERLKRFYDVLVAARRRQGSPPQPFAWFRNLASCFGDRLTVRIASTSDRQVVAAIITLAHNRTLTYKYGAMDKRFSNVGGMPYVLWNAIEDAKRNGFTEFDFGRSDADNLGLIEFKRRWGTQESELLYGRQQTRRPRETVNNAIERVARIVVSRTPTEVLLALSRTFYRHLG
jgi:hypothetical protein